MELINKGEAINIATSLVLSELESVKFRLNDAHLHEDDLLWQVVFLLLDDDGNYLLTMEPGALTVFVNCVTREAYISPNM